jgi:hypothetical protein
MLKLTVALRNHAAREGVDVEIRDEGEDTAMGGGWIDANDLAEPLDKLLTTLVEYCNAEALDPDELDDANGFIAGRSSMAHSILQQIAASGVVF